MTTVHVLVYGRVQGVGFRNFVEGKAKDFKIQGWVRNLSNGSVEAVLQGSDSAVNRLIAECKKGPFLALVDKIVARTIPEKEQFSNFQVLSTK
ncbi:MAG: acylphosphatase [Candidatus Aenigmarchaeota archaeon]|nr:acylphosphatase [Candidatus Aenigmarchaeota archaeon]